MWSVVRKERTEKRASKKGAERNETNENDDTPLLVGSRSLLRLLLLLLLVLGLLLLNLLLLLVVERLLSRLGLLKLKQLSLGEVPLVVAVDLLSMHLLLLLLLSGHGLYGRRDHQRRGGKEAKKRGS